MLAQQISAIQSALAEAGLDGWFFACFQQNDPLGMSLLGLTGEGKLVSRRCYYLVPREGEPRKLVHAIEPGMLDHLPGGKTVYNTWQGHSEGVAGLVSGFPRLAAQYSPNNELPTVSRLDAGTFELLRAAGVDVVSSADLAQQFEVSIRTIYRDLEGLSEGGVPLVATPGKGYRLLDGYFLPPGGPGMMRGGGERRSSGPATRAA